MGAGKGFANVVGLAIGTGVAGGHAVNGQLVPDMNGQHGEYGHVPLPATFAAEHDLPIIKCGCGLTGCFETYLAGPGLVRLAEQLTGQTYSSHEIMSGLPTVRAAWLQLVSHLVALITRAHDPDVIILGGGLGMIEGLPADLVDAMDGQMLANTDLPQIMRAAHGDASGALGAAIHALQLQEHYHD